jgi:hypothetical protein
MQQPAAIAIAAAREALPAGGNTASPNNNASPTAFLPSTI